MDGQVHHQTAAGIKWVFSIIFADGTEADL
jgi:hypothetical protein